MWDASISAFLLTFSNSIYFSNYYLFMISFYLNNYVFSGGNEQIHKLKPVIIN